MLVHIAKWESKTNIVPYHICELVKDRIKNLLSRNRSAKVGDLPYTIRRLDDTSRFNIYGDVVIETNEADICLGGAWGTNGKVELRYQEDLRHTTIDVFAASGYEQEAKKAWGSLAQELSERNYASRIWEPESLPDGAPNTTFEPDCYPFNGTPDIFASIFREFVSANRDIPKTYIIDRDKNRVIAGICAGYAESVFLDSYPIPPACRIIVTIQPGGAYSRIRLELETPPLYVVSPFVDRFVEYFKKEGWLLDTMPSNEAGENQTQTKQAAAMPIPNKDGATWDDFFDWYYLGGIVKYPDIKGLTSAIPFAVGTINNNHSLYVQQYGKKPRLKSE